MLKARDITHPLTSLRVNDMLAEPFDPDCTAARPIYRARPAIALLVGMIVVAARLVWLW